MRELIMLVKMNREAEMRLLLGPDRFERLVRELREVVQAACRDTDSTWRGEDDSCLAILTVEDTQSGVTLAERIRSRVAEHLFDAGDGVELGITCAIGFSSYPLPESEHGSDIWHRAVALARLAVESAESVAEDDWVGFVSPASKDDAPPGVDDVFENPRMVVRHDLEAARRARCDLDLLLLTVREEAAADTDPAR